MLGDKIKLYRENKKMTQNEIANILDVSPATVSKYESGALEPNIESLKRLAELFEISIDELLNDQEDKFDISKINVLDILREQKEMKLKGNLYHRTQVSFAYNTNHIEGSTLTEDQTRYIFETNTIGSGIKTTSPNNVEKEMSKLIDWYNSLKNVTIKDIIEFHYRFESIHPFQDGNGRIGRIIMFKECLKNNIIPFIIFDKDKLFYYRGLKEYKNEKGYLVDTCLNAQDQYANVINYFLK